MKFESLMTMPFMDALRLIVGGAVEEYLNRSGLLKAIAEAAKRDKQSESGSLDAEGALAFLKANGYPMKKGQLYKMTSDRDSDLPFYKFGNKLHFKKDELLVWAESKLSPISPTATIPNYKLYPMAFLALWHVHGICRRGGIVPKCQLCQGGIIQNLTIIRYSTIALKNSHSAIMSAVVYHCSGSAVPSVQGRHGNYFPWNFLRATASK